MIKSKYDKSFYNDYATDCNLYAGRRWQACCQQVTPWRDVDDFPPNIPARQTCNNNYGNFTKNSPC